jgi:hypothetical protein
MPTSDLEEILAHADRRTPAAVVTHLSGVRMPYRISEIAPRSRPPQQRC